jgi:hypothetical protein
MVPTTTPAKMMSGICIDFDPSAVAGDDRAEVSDKTPAGARRGAGAPPLKSMVGREWRSSGSRASGTRGILQAETFMRPGTIARPTRKNSTLDPAYLP